MLLVLYIDPLQERFEQNGFSRNKNMFYLTGYELMWEVHRGSYILLVSRGLPRWSSIQVLAIMIRSSVRGCVMPCQVPYVISRLRLTTS